MEHAFRTCEGRVYEFWKCPHASSSAKRRANAIDIENGRNFASADADIVPMEASRTFSRLAQNRRVGKVVTKAWQGLDAAAATLSDGVRLYPLRASHFFVLVFHSHVRLLFVAQVATQRAHCRVAFTRRGTSLVVLEACYASIYSN